MITERARRAGPRRSGYLPGMVDTDPDDDAPLPGDREPGDGTVDAPGSPAGDEDALRVTEPPRDDAGSRRLPLETPLE